MTKKYHTSLDGQLRICSAKTKCPIGGVHFDDLREAQQHLDRKNEDYIFHLKGLENRSKYGNVVATDYILYTIDKDGEQIMKSLNDDKGFFSEVELNCNLGTDELENIIDSVNYYSRHHGLYLKSVNRKLTDLKNHPYKISMEFVDKNNNSIEFSTFSLDYDKEYDYHNKIVMSYKNKDIDKTTYIDYLRKNNNFLSKIKLIDMGVDTDTLLNHSNAKVREHLAKNGYHLEILSNDLDMRVRSEAKKQLAKMNENN